MVVGIAWKVGITIAKSCYRWDDSMSRRSWYSSNYDNNCCCWWCCCHRCLFRFDWVVRQAWRRQRCL